MKSTVKKLIIISFLLAIIAAGAVFVYLQSLNETMEVDANQTTILVAIEDIPPRTKIDLSMVRQIEVPNSEVFNQYINDGQAVVGKYTRETIFKNEGFVSGKLFDESNSDLSVRVEQNHRAVSVSVSSDQGVSYLIKPGDFVDVIGFFAEKSGTRTDTAKTVLQNIRILSMDQKLNRDQVPNNQETIPGNFLVTLSVPNGEVEKLVLAQGVGNIKLVLRSPSDITVNTTRGAVWSDITNNTGASQPEQVN